MVLAQSHLAYEGCFRKDSLLTWQFCLPLEFKMALVRTWKPRSKNIIEQICGPNITKFWQPTPLEWTIVDIFLTTQPLFMWPGMDFLLVTNLLESGIDAPPWINVALEKKSNINTATRFMLCAEFEKSLPPTPEVIAPHNDALHAIFAHMRSLGPNLQKSLPAGRDIHI